jgi:ABC-type polysaccharide/polyol phosphate transport system ATPase subunit
MAGRRVTVPHRPGTLGAVETGAVMNAPTRASRITGPVVIEARDVCKTFRIPDQRIDSFKERATHPFRRLTYRELHALRGISFDVHKGEFFGIVGRNGSGKSTLLKLMASIYRRDGGRIRMAGRLAPFIELGVGFNPELTSRENVILNGVLMGLSRQEARRRFDAVLEFAELGEFADMKLKNYSSGMMVRLAFAVMVEADADIMLIDEVLAVGDAAFAQKCMDVFRARREAGKTIVLVTHDMATVQSFCDRAMVIHDGEQLYLGDPQEAALRYYRLNFARGPEPGDALGVPDVHVSMVDAWLESPAGRRAENVEQGDPIGFGVVFEARQELVNPVFIFQVDQASTGATVFGFSRTLGDDATVAAGQRVRISGTVENPLLPGRYQIVALVLRNRSVGDLALQPVRLLDFVVFGTQPGPGTVSVAADVEATLEPGG